MKNFQQREQEEEEARARARKDKSALTEDANKARIVSQYGKIEEEMVDTSQDGSSSRHRPGKAQEDAAPVIELPPEGKKALKQWRAQQIDLLVKPNNAEIVKLKDQKEREAAREKAASKKTKDKEDLLKQRQNQAKDLEAKRKKAAKVERRA